MEKPKPEISKLNLDDIREHIKQLEHLEAELKRYKLYNLIICLDILNGMEKFKTLREQDEAE